MRDREKSMSPSRRHLRVFILLGTVGWVTWATAGEVPVVPQTPLVAPTPQVETTPQVARTPQVAVTPQIAPTPQVTVTAQVAPTPQVAATPQILAAPRVGRALGAGSMIGPAWWRHSGLVSPLDLEDHQISRLEQEHSEHRRRIESLQQSLALEEDLLSGMLRQSSTEHDALKRQMRRAVEARSALEAERSDFLLVIREVLSATQWQILSERVDPLTLTRAVPPAPPMPPSFSPKALSPLPSTPVKPRLVPAPRVGSPILKHVPVIPAAPVVSAAPALRPLQPSAPIHGVAPDARPVVKAAPAPPIAPAPRPVLEPSIAEPHAVPEPRAILEPQPMITPEPPSISVPEPVAAPVPPEPPTPVIWWHDSSSRSRLGLTQGQVERLDHTANQHADHLATIHRVIRRSEAELQPIIDSDALDGKAARSKLSELGRARLDLRLAMRDMKLDLLNVLTSDQRVQLHSGQ